MTRRRETSVTNYATPTDREIVITRTVDAPVGVVFNAWTHRDLVPRWLGPDGWTMPVCEIDLRPGGTWRYLWRKEAGAEMEMSGSYREVAPPKRAVWTESWRPEWPTTLNTLVLTDSGGRTAITLTVSYPTKTARDAAMATGMTQGVDQSFDRLDEVLRSLE